MTEQFLPAYGGQSTDELLALAGRYRIDSLVLAFEQAIQSKAPTAISREESWVLAVEALEREVNNGGYAQFFINSSNLFASTIEAALRAIECPRTAEITRDAVAALNLEGEPTPAAVEKAAMAENHAVQQALARCDERYFANDEPIADRLFAWIGTNRGRIRVGNV
jgi:hypothetical protein